MLFQILLALVACSLAVNSLSELEIRAISDYIENELMPANNIPGFGLTIVDGEDSLATAFGYRDLESGLLAQNDTLFGIGSVSKVNAFRCILTTKLYQMCFSIY